MWKQDHKYGRSVKKCLNCGTNHAIIRKYKLDVCRKCFKQLALNSGWHYA